MLTHARLTQPLEEVGMVMLDTPNLKAVMMSKDEFGDVVVKLVEGKEDSHKVQFGRIDRRARILTVNRVRRIA